MHVVICIHSFGCGMHFAVQNLHTFSSVPTHIQSISSLISPLFCSIGRDISIVDAEEMEYPKVGADDSHRAAILTKIQLHQKVFPQHKVVGWYRVQKHDDENCMNDNDGVVPSEDDLRMNQNEMARYCSVVDGKDNSGHDHDAESPLFVLMNAAKTNGGSGGDNNKKPSATNNASEEMEVDEELPLTVYETLASPDGGAVFVNVDFELETFEPERIAVEMVFKTQPSQMAVASTVPKEAAAAGKGEEERKTGKKSKKDESDKQHKSSKPAFTRGPTELDSQLDSLQSSIRAMNVRMNVLLEFLQRVEKGEITPEDSLLRSVDGLVRQMPLVLAALEEGQASTAGANGRKPLRELDNEYSNTMLLTYLAAVAKTAKSVHVYSEKFRNSCESGKSDPRRSVW